MEDNKLAADEGRRIAQHDEIKSRVEGGVNREIAVRADRSSRGESEALGRVAGDFRAKAVDEVVETEREVDRSRAVARVFDDLQIAALTGWFDAEEHAAPNRDTAILPPLFSHCQRH